jgi:hypothetical protein
MPLVASVVSELLVILRPAVSTERKAWSLTLAKALPMRPFLLESRRIEVCACDRRMEDNRIDLEAARPA